MSFVELGKQLLEAAKNGSLEEVRTLMFNGAPFTTDWLGTSPLHYAAQNGQYEMVDVLLKAGLSRDARTKVDRTPLHYASQEGHSEIVSLLIWYGADVEAKDMLKMTPLHWAVEKGHIDVVQILLAHGATSNGMNKFDKTPLDIALSNRRADIAEMLQLSYNGGSPLEVHPEAVIEEVTTSENDVSCFVSQNIICSGLFLFSSTFSLMQLF